jgi:hypothetical protein
MAATPYRAKLDPVANGRNKAMMIFYPDALYDIVRQRQQELINEAAERRQVVRARRRGRR